MKFFYLATSLFILSANCLQAQSAGTYDTSFSGDGKEVYVANTSAPIIFAYNNEVLSFLHTPCSDNSSIREISLVKYSSAGVFLSKKVILADSLTPSAQRKTYSLNYVKQTTNGKFVISFNESFFDDFISDAYSAGIVVVDAAGNLDNTFDSDGRKDLFSGSFSVGVYVRFKIDLFADNSIFAVSQYLSSGTYSKINCRKINTLGVITNTFNVGAGNYNYYHSDVKVNSDNTVFISGSTNFSPSPNGFRKHFIFKLTPSFNYDISFNSTGKRFISKGDADNYNSDIFLLNSASTDLYAFFQVADSTNIFSSNRPTHVQKYNSNGVFSSEKLISSPGTALVIKDIKEDSNGKIVLLSSLYDTLYANPKTYLIRLNPSALTYDATFNSNGKKTISFSGSGISENYSNDLFIQSDNKILLSSTASYTTSTYNTTYGAFARINGTAVVPTNVFGTTETEFHVYPNPAKDQLKIRLASKDQLPVSVDFYNVSSQLVKSVVIDNETDQIDLLDLSEGLYFVKASNNKELNQTTRLLIQK